MRENIVALRIENAKLERSLVSRPARRAVRRIRAELARRGLTTAQREHVLHDSLLMLAEGEASGTDPIEMLLGVKSVSEYDAAITSFCDDVAAECPRLPVPLTVLRFFATMLVVLGAVMGVHLIWVFARPVHGWLDPALVRLTNLDEALLTLELVSVPVFVLFAQVISSAIPRNPVPRGLVLVLSFAFCALGLDFLKTKTILFSSRGIWRYTGSNGLAFVNLAGALSHGVSEVTWMAVSRVGSVLFVVGLLAIGLGALWLIESRTSKGRRRR